jgi:hypothetical protein
MSSPVNLIFSPGTRIVTRNNANRIGGGELIQTGAVAVITQSPADAKRAYKVRFNDCAEAFKKLEQDLRNRGEIKWKHAMHLMRLLLSGISALREGELRVRLDEHRTALLAIKRGEQPWPEVNAWHLRLHKEFDEALPSTKLPSVRITIGLMSFWLRRGGT